MGTDTEQNANAADADAIVCRITPWYVRRMGLMMVLLVGCGFWFLYDGVVGWPKGNHRADIYDAHRTAIDGGTWEKAKVELGDEARRLGLPEANYGDDSSPQMIEVREAFDAGAAGEKWSTYAAERKLSETKPDRHPQKAIDGQFNWAYGAFILGGAVLVLALINLPKKLTADRTGFNVPGGRRVEYSQVFLVDKKKWDNKGLAYVHYREGDSREKRAVIDDLKFQGAVRILDRLLDGFEGEVIERLSLDDEDEDEEDEDGGEEASGAPGEDLEKGG